MRLSISMDNMSLCSERVKNSSMGFINENSSPVPRLSLLRTTRCNYRYTVASFSRFSPQENVLSTWAGYEVASSPGPSSPRRGGAWGQGYPYINSHRSPDKKPDILQWYKATICHNVSHLTKPVLRYPFSVHLDSNHGANVPHTNVDCWSLTSVDHCTYGAGRMKMKVIWRKGVVCEVVGCGGRRTASADPWVCGRHSNNH